MLKLKLQYFGHLMGRTDSFEKTLMLGRIEGGRRREQQRLRQLADITNQWTWVWVSLRSLWWTGKPGVLQSMGRKESDMTEQLNWLTDYWRERGWWMGILGSLMNFWNPICIVLQQSFLFKRNKNGYRIHSPSSDDAKSLLTLICMNLTQERLNKMGLPIFIWK